MLPTLQFATDSYTGLFYCQFAFCQAINASFPGRISHFFGGSRPIGYAGSAGENHAESRRQPAGLTGPGGSARPRGSTRTDAGGIPPASRIPGRRIEGGTSRRPDTPNHAGPTRGAPAGHGALLAGPGSPGSRGRCGVTLVAPGPSGPYEGQCSRSSGARSLVDPAQAGLQRAARPGAQPATDYGPPATQGSDAVTRVWTLPRRPRQAPGAAPCQAARYCSAGGTARVRRPGAPGGARRSYASCLSPQGSRRPAARGAGRADGRLPITGRWLLSVAVGQPGRPPADEAAAACRRRKRRPWSRKTRPVATSPGTSGILRRSTHRT